MIKIKLFIDLELKDPPKDEMNMFWFDDGWYELGSIDQLIKCKLLDVLDTHSVLVTWIGMETK